MKNRGGWEVKLNSKFASSEDARIFISLKLFYSFHRPTQTPIPYASVQNVRAGPPARSPTIEVINHEDVGHVIVCTR